MEGRELKDNIFSPSVNIRNWKRDLDVPCRKKGYSRSSTVFYLAAKLPKADAHVNALVFIPTGIVCLKWCRKGMRGKSRYCWNKILSIEVCSHKILAKRMAAVHALPVPVAHCFLSYWHFSGHSWSSFSLRNCIGHTAVYWYWWGRTVTSEEPNEPWLKLTVTSSVGGSAFLSPSCKEGSTGNRKAIHPRLLASPVPDATHPNQYIIQTNKGSASSKDTSFSSMTEQIKYIFNCQRTGQHFISYVRFFPA